MYLPLQIALAAGALLLAAGAIGYVARDRLADRWLLGLLALLEVLLVVQAVVGIVQVATDNPGVSAPLFVGYLLGTLLFLPAAAWWALGEPSRAGTAGLVVVGLVLPVLVLRLQQIWQAPGA